jgi:hypothetical protein
MKKRKLPKGWQWSYVFPPMEGFAYPDKWTACAVRLASDKVKVLPYGEAREYFEVFETGNSHEEVVNKVIERIKSKVPYKKRFICFPDYEEDEN